jgi:uncharacterized protein
MRLVVDSGPQPVVIAPASEAEEVAQNVRMILSTPKGTVPLDRDFGLSFGLVDQPMPRARALMEVEIVRQVAKYEPRASVVSIRWEENQDEAMDGRANPVVTIEVREVA